METTNLKEIHDKKGRNRESADNKKKSEICGAEKFYHPRNKVTLEVERQQKKTSSQFTKLKVQGAAKAKSIGLADH